MTFAIQLVQFQYENGTLSLFFKTRLKLEVILSLMAIFVFSVTIGRLKCARCSLFCPTVRHVSGANIIVADPLSRFEVDQISSSFLDFEDLTKAQ